MAQNITIAGASFADVPAIDVPKTGGGTARYIDPAEIKAELLAALDSDFVAENIKKDVDLFGLVGTLEGGGVLQGFKFLATGTITPAADISSEYTVNIGGEFTAWDDRYTVICLFPENIRSFVTNGTINFTITGNTKSSTSGGATSYYNSSGSRLALAYGLIEKPGHGTSNYSFTIECSSNYKMIASNTYRWVMLTREDQTV